MVLQGLIRQGSASILVWKRLEISMYQPAYRGALQQGTLFTSEVGGLKGECQVPHLGGRSGV